MLLVNTYSHAAYCEKWYHCSSNTPVNAFSQGPRNLYGRDGKFRSTFKSGTEKSQFSIPRLLTCFICDRTFAYHTSLNAHMRCQSATRTICRTAAASADGCSGLRPGYGSTNLMTWCPQNAPNCQICTYVHKIFWGCYPQTPKTGDGLSPLSRLLSVDEHPPSQFFRTSAAAAFSCPAVTVSCVRH